MVYPLMRPRRGFVPSSSGGIHCTRNELPVMAEKFAERSWRRGARIPGETRRRAGESSPSAATGCLLVASTRTRYLVAGRTGRRNERSLSSSIRSVGIRPELRRRSASSLEFSSEIQKLLPPSSTTRNPLTFTSPNSRGFLQQSASALLQKSSLLSSIPSSQRRRKGTSRWQEHTKWTQGSAQGAGRRMVTIFTRSDAISF
mmetsp:Transcript_1970/g.4488  ORF Transcript_1970/g.4488 Transcript_1970/m.4488 type:complete len:201 (+) Transcript_1970:171-773(+)